ncbi:MAG TPA: hypothetical protein VG455_00885 [Acidimicrobiales bacterium]|nr:hypothetical protein [Acidimicrobiales bacterium]
MSEISERYHRLADELAATASYEGAFGPSTFENAVDGFGNLDQTGLLNLLGRGADA